MTKLLLHPRTQLQFDVALNRSGHSFIFEGLAGVGKHAAAIEFARRVNCLGDTAGACANCRKLARGNSPDLIELQREDKTSIPIEQVRKLISDVTLKSAGSKTQRVIVIDDSQTLAVEAQNALLKLLEEPPYNTSIILLTPHANALLPTIRSRCSRVSFISPGADALAEFLRNIVHLDVAGARRLAVLSDGLPGIAIALHSDPKATETLGELQELAIHLLEKTHFERLVLAGRLHAQIDMSMLGQLLQRHITTSIQAGVLTAKTAMPQLEALEVFRRQLRARVSARPALERLMLRLG